MSNAVTGDTAELERPKRSAVTGWVLYDLANTVFSMGVVSLGFPLWVRDQVGARGADRTVGLVTALSMGVIFVLSPVLGSMTDRARRRLPFLVVSTLGCVALTAALGAVAYWPTLVAFALANILYQAGLQFYDALLPSVSTPSTRGRIGGIGVGVGYLGSVVAVALATARAKLNAPHCQFFAATALVFLLLSLPCFLWVKEKPNPAPGPVWSPGAMARAMRETLATLRQSKEHPGLVRFLIGRVLYTDPINTVITVMMLYSINVAETGGMQKKAAEGAARMVMFGAILFAVVGGFVWGRLVDRWGSRRVLGWVLWLWLVTFALAASLGLLALPWKLLIAVSILAGLALGGTWSADRPLMLELTPPERLGEFYGLYGMVGRFSAVFGPLIWALVTSAVIRAGASALRAQGVGVLVLLVFIVVSMRVLAPLTGARGMRWVG
ncbi:MAG: MFS transporter [Polyangiaceae bacterium]|nr:MFS transporter [Polyangiaceae bacterium]